MGEPINIKFTPSKLYANWDVTPGEVKKVEVPLNLASIVDNDNVFPALADK